MKECQYVKLSELRKLVAFSWWLASVCVLQVSRICLLEYFHFFIALFKYFVHMNWLTFLHFDLDCFPSYIGGTHPANCYMPVWVLNDWYYCRFSAFKAGSMSRFLQNQGWWSCLKTQGNTWLSTGSTGLCFEVYVHSLCRSPEVCECWQKAAFQNILVLSLTLLISHYLCVFK